MPSSGNQERLQSHLRKSRSARSLKFAHILTDGRVMFGLQLSLVWRSSSDARFPVPMQPVARVERDRQCAPALRGCLLHRFWSRYAKTVVGDRKRVSCAQTCSKALMELIPNVVRQRRRWFVIDAQYLLPHRVRPAGKKASFGRRCPAFYSDNSGHVDAPAPEISDQRISRNVITYRADGQDAGAKRCEIIGGIGAAPGDNLS